MNDYTSPPSVTLRDGLMIAWRSECYRSTMTAETFSVPLRLIWKTDSGKLRRYIISFIKTMAILFKERPQVAMVMNLPTFTPIAVWLASFVTRSQIILDFHSGALTDPFWKKFAFFYRWIVRRSPFTICHNLQDGRQVESWGGRPFYLVALPRTFDSVQQTDSPSKPSFFVVCSFKADEPVDLMIAAMRECPEVRFQVTGNYRRAGLRPEQMPPNIELLGFIDYGFYLQCMSESTAIITLSDRSYIMQAAVHEAISLGVPVVANHSETLRWVLGDAAAFCDLETSDLVAAIESATHHAKSMRREARKLKSKMYHVVDESLCKLVETNPELFVSKHA